MRQSASRRYRLTSRRRAARASASRTRATSSVVIRGAQRRRTPARRAEPERRGAMGPRFAQEIRVVARASELRAGRHRVAGTLAMPGHIGRMLVGVLVNDRHSHDAAIARADDERRETPAAVRVGRNVTIDAEPSISSNLARSSGSGAPRRSAVTILDDSVRDEFSAPSLSNQPVSRCRDGTDRSGFGKTCRKREPLRGSVLSQVVSGA